MTAYQTSLLAAEHIEVAHGGSDWWCTPESSLTAPMFGLAHVRLFYDGQIDLDPCSNKVSTVGARVTYTIADDGLAQPWAGDAKWVNPPYSDCRPWLARCQSSTERGGRSEALALVKGDWSPSWWQEYVRTATARCELSQRVKFVVPAGSNGSPPWPSVLVYWGPRVDRFARIFGPLGEIVRGSLEIDEAARTAAVDRLLGRVPSGIEQPSADLPAAPGWTPG